MSSLEDNDSTSIEEDLTIDSCDTLGDKNSLNLQNDSPVQKKHPNLIINGKSSGKYELDKASSSTRLSPAYHKKLSQTIKGSGSDRKESITVMVSMVQKVPIKDNQRAYMVRPSSVPRNKTKKPFEKEVGLYPQSLKLLGVNIPNCSQQVRPSRCTSSQSWIGTPAKLQTRVTRRSTSLDDVKRAIPQFKDTKLLSALNLDPHQRAVLSQAIYEEWYMTKKKQIKENINSQNKLLEMQELEKIKGKPDAQTSKENVDKWWKEKRAKEREAKRTEQQRLMNIRSKKTEELLSKERNSEYMKTWRKKKRKQVILEQKQQLEELEKRHKLKMEQLNNEREKRQLAEQGFHDWLQKKKEMQRQNKIKKQQQIRLRDQEMTERMEIAKQGYEHWKREKKNTNRKIPVNMLLEDALKIEDHKRSTEALEAYEKWLDDADEKQIVDNINLQKLSLLATLKPPWNPGGGSGLVEDDQTKKLSNA